MQVSVSVTNGGLWQGGLRNSNISSAHQQQPPQEEEEEVVEVVEADASAVALPSPRGRGRVGSDDVGIKRVAAWAVDGSSSRHRQHAQP